MPADWQARLLAPILSIGGRPSRRTSPPPRFTGSRASDGACPSSASRGAASTGARAAASTRAPTSIAVGSVIIDGIPTTDIDRTILDLAGRSATSGAARDRVGSTRRTQPTGRDLIRRLPVTLAGRPGIRRLRRVILANMRSDRDHRQRLRAARPRVHPRGRASRARAPPQGVRRRSLRRRGRPRVPGTKIAIELDGRGPPRGGRVGAGPPAAERPRPARVDRPALQLAALPRPTGPGDRRDPSRDPAARASR